MNNKNKRSDPGNDLYRAILMLRDTEECYRFFDDLCTFSEIQAMTQRLQVARMLEEGCTFSQISKEIGVSSATITRVNKCISYGADGYKIALERLGERGKPQKA